MLTEVRPSETLMTIDLPVKEIYGDPEFNCRGRITPFDVIELVRSIEASGLHQPIVIRAYPNHPPYKWRVIMGHRRLKAFEVMKQTTIPCIVKEGLSDIQERTLNLVENLERQDLTFMQEARAIEKFQKNSLVMKDIARLINKSIGWVQNRVAALGLPEEIQRELDAGFLNQEQIRELASVPSTQRKFEIFNQIKDAKLRGEKLNVKIKPKRKPNPRERRHRSPAEIYELQDHIRNTVGNNFGTRCLAWAAGEINRVDLLTDLKAFADEAGIPYTIPSEYLY